MLRAFLKASDAMAAAEARTGHGPGEQPADPSAPPRPDTIRSEDGGAPGPMDRLDAPDPVRQNPVRQSRDGGWRRGVLSIRGRHEGVAFAAGVDAQGEAWLSVDGVTLSPISVTFAPWGFRMTVGDLVEGVSYAAGLRPPEGPPRLSILPYGPGLLQFGARIRVPCERFDPQA